MCYFRLEKKKKTVLRPIQYERDERKSHHHQKKIVTVILINSFFFLSNTLRGNVKIFKNEP